MKRIKQLRKQKSLSSFLRWQKDQGKYRVILKMSDGSHREISVNDAELASIIRKGLIKNKEQYSGNLA